MHSVYLSLGSNQGDRKAHLDEAIRLLGEEAGSVERVADYIETEPSGFVSCFDFLNTAILLKTNLEPLSLLALTQELERRLGRERKSTPDGDYSDRPIDIDLLFFDDMIYLSEQLIIPHPRVEERQFVLEPLYSIAPNLKHPQSGKTISELYSQIRKARPH